MGAFGSNFGSSFAGAAIAIVVSSTKTVSADLCVTTSIKKDLCVTTSIKEDLCV